MMFNKKMMFFNAQKYFAAGQRRVWQAKAAKLVVF